MIVTSGLTRSSGKTLAVCSPCSGRGSGAIIRRSAGSIAVLVDARSSSPSSSTTRPAIRAAACP